MDRYSKGRKSRTKVSTNANVKRLWRKAPIQQPAFDTGRFPQDALVCLTRCMWKRRHRTFGANFKLSYSTSWTKAPSLKGSGGPKYLPTRLPSHSSGTAMPTPSLVLYHLVYKESAFSIMNSSSATACICAANVSALGAAPRDLLTCGFSW